MKLYAGIGSRETPPEVLRLMAQRAFELAMEGYTLRSGGAKGADQAFEGGWSLSSGPGLAEIWLPWKGYNNHTSPRLPSPDAFVMAKRFHPHWLKCSDLARKFHARNCHIILGADLQTPVEFVLFWTPTGRATGGTGQGLRIAQHYQIPYHLVTAEPLPVSNVDGTSV